MRCIVTNQTNETLKFAQVGHKTGGHTDRGDQSDIDVGGTFEFELTYDSSSADYWDIDAFTARGDHLTRKGKKCSIEDEDVHSGNPVHINFHPRSEGWDVALPVSSSCLENYYD